MRFLALDLSAFGPFTDLQLDLSAGSEGLHILYGPNEAGKSSLLRALRQLLFGIGERTADAFLHDYKKLKLGAKLRARGGAELEFVRRKGRKDTLLAANGKTTFDEQLLQPFLGGMEEGLFTSLFGIDHIQLAEGSKELLREGGQLGHVLFRTGSGVTRLREVQESLQKDLEALFKPRGKDQAINRTLRDLDQCLKSIHAAQLPSDEWQRHTRALEEATSKKKTADEEHERLQRERSRLDRLQSALPLAGQRRELLKQLESCRDAVLLPENFTEVRRTAQNDLNKAELAGVEAKREIERLRGELADLQPPDALLQQAKEIADLHQRLGAYLKGEEDRPRLEDFLSNQERNAREVLRQLGKATDLVEAESLRQPLDVPVRVRKLAIERSAIAARCETGRKKVAEMRRELKAAEEKLGGLAAPRDSAGLKRLVRVLRKEAGLEETLTKEQGKLLKLEKQIQTELKRLPLWSGSLDALEELVVPSLETLRRFEEAFDQLQARCDSWTEKLQAEGKDLARLRQKLERLQLEGDVPSESDLTAARQQRETLWLRARQAWQVQRFEQELADTVERQVAHADELADRLRREAGRVAQKAELQASLALASETKAELSRSLEETTRRLAEQQQSWAALWQPVGLTPREPREMRAWLDQHKELLAQAKAVREQRSTVAGLRERAEQLCGELRSELASMGEATENTTKLALLLEQAEEVVENCATIEQERQRLARACEETQSELLQAEEQLQKDDADLVAWSGQWRPLMERLGLAPSASDEEANAVLEALDRLSDHLREAREHRSRLKGMDRDVATFCQDVRNLAERLLPDGKDQPPRQVVEALAAQLDAAHRLAQKRDDLQEREAKETAKLTRAHSDGEDARARLRTLCAEAGCERAEELPDAERRAEQRRTLERELRQLEQQLRVLCGNRPWDTFIAEAESEDPDALTQKLKQLDQQLHALKTELDQLNQGIGRERTELERMDGSASAAEHVAEAEALRARLRTDVRSYALHRLAASVLSQGIQRYRARHHGPLLERASRLFKELTNGSFAGLQLDDADAGSLLRGVRPGVAEPLGVEAMSDGSCDQLYLALRLASLEAYLAGHEPMPFIVDDLLLQFDDARAAAALRVLAELSCKTQVLFFTHHEHLVELARRSVPTDVLVLHRLPGPTVRQPGDLFAS